MSDAATATQFTFRVMREADRHAAFLLFDSFLNDDPHIVAANHVYGAGGSAALERALALFIERPEIGFVWLGFERDEAIAGCVVCYAISTSRGAIVVKLDDVTVRADHLGQGIGSKMLNALFAYLRTQGVARVDTSCHLDNADARRFYDRLGFQSLGEERLAKLL